MENRTKIANLLIQAVVNNDVQMLSKLHNNGADPNYTLDASQITTLHYAAQNNALEVIPLLVEAGAILEAQTEPDGYTALEVAFLHGNDKIAQTLIAYANESDASKH